MQEQQEEKKNYVEKQENAENENDACIKSEESYDASNDLVTITAQDRHLGDLALLAQEHGDVMVQCGEGSFLWSRLLLASCSPLLHLLLLDPDTSCLLLPSYASCLVRNTFTLLCRPYGGQGASDIDLCGILGIKIPVKEEIIDETMEPVLKEMQVEDEVYTEPSVKKLTENQIKDESFHKTHKKTVSDQHSKLMNYETNVNGNLDSNEGHHISYNSRKVDLKDYIEMRKQKNKIRQLKERKIKDLTEK